MPILTAQIDTERPSRYLVQFCKHAAAMGGGGHKPRMHRRDMTASRDVQVHAEWSDTHGTVIFAPWGRCTIAADANTLTLRIEATDEDGLRQIQDVITRDFDRFGRRESLAVTWHQPETPDGTPRREPDHPVVYRQQNRNHPPDLAEDADRMNATDVQHGGPLAHRADIHADPCAGLPPWEIGRPQPAFAALAEAGAFQGRVLDLGCGTGEHALLAARLGLDVTGIDLSDTALRIAERNAAERGLTARFLHFDARRLTELGGELFDTVIDCELFHALEGADRAAYVTGLRSVLRPGGRYFLLCYSDSQPDVPHRVSRDEIPAAFADGWSVDSIEPATIDTNIHPEGVRGWLAALFRAVD
jgi:hypothetical protein